MGGVSDAGDDEEVEYLFTGDSVDGVGSSSDVDEFSAVPDDDESEPQVGGDTSKEERSAMPTWLKQDYADLRERLAREIKSNVSRKPTCYERNTFIDGTPFSFFSANRKFQPLPEDHYRPCYFIWIPHLLIGRIPCPSCCAAG
jgi:hypothetical protein